MENQQEKYKIWWDEDNQIVRAKFVDGQDEVCAQSALEEMQKMVMDKPDTVLLLIDLSEAGSVCSSARKKFVEMAKLKKYKKQAIFGMNAVSRVIASFVIKFAGVTNVQQFATENEALAWLKEK
jgi:hypothetical protein